MEQADRVRDHTSQKINDRIDRQIDSRIAEYSARTPAEIIARINELDREWDIERWLETNAAAFALAGVALGAFHDRRWLVVPGLVLGFLMQHALQGWCPPLPIFRRLGVRTRKEIDRERYALTMLRTQIVGM